MAVISATVLIGCSKEAENETEEVVDTTEQVAFDDVEVEDYTVLSYSELEVLAYQAISNYFAQKAEEEIDRLWEDGTLTEAKVESFRSLHERTAYK